MDFRRLRYFARIVEAGSITRASTTLNVAQPALSKAIQALERDFETPLLQRSTHGVATTEGGQRLYEHCQILFKQLERAKLDVRKSVDRPSGHVTVGMPHSIGKILTIPLLEATTRLYPQVQIEISQDQSHVLSDRVRSGRLDFAVMAASRPVPGLSMSPLLREELFFVELPDEDRRVDHSPIAFIEAATRRYVLPAVGNGLRASVEGHFRSRGLQLNVAHEVDAIAMILDCVAAGLGAAILPGGCIQGEQAARALTIRPFAEGGCRRAIGVCYSPSKTFTPAAVAMMRLVEKLAHERVAQALWLGASLSQVPQGE
jgi:LysR family nitrogen assimilation transcriptional regulator